MVKLRLRRTGRIKSPSYQIIAIDSRKPRDGKYLEKIGHYYPLKKIWDLDLERVEKWLKVGAKPSKTVAALIQKTRRENKQ